MLYLDNNATTPIDPEVLEAMLPYLKEEYGNPASRHYTLATNAEKAVEHAREQVAALIHAEPKEIIFTAGASESNNFILKGVTDYSKYYGNGKNHVITSKVEHKSVLQTCQFLDGSVYDNRKLNKAASKFIKTAPKMQKVDRGFEVSFLGVNEHSQVEVNTFIAAIQENSLIASFMWANNETGALNDIASLVKIAKEHNVLFHTDATQAVGKLAIDVKEVPVDFMSFSAHKLYGPKGIGACFIRQNGLPYKITSLIHGGQQEFGYRAGTSSVHNIVGFGKSCELAKRDLEKNIMHLKKLEIMAKKMLVDKYEGIQFLADSCAHVPGVVSAVVPGIVNEILIKRLAETVAISSGSACGIGEPSYVIKEMDEKISTNNFVRISFNKYIDNIEDLTHI